MLKKMALCASVLTLSALGSASGALAYDAPANSFYPAAGWDISKRSAQAGASAHCLLVTEYNNGFFVQFQGRDGGLDVIAIDLRQNVFQEGQSVPVTVTIPGKTSVRINGTAFNNEVVTLDMSGQDGLLETLRGASAMDVDIAGSAFRFFLTGFTNALQGFDRCNQAAPQETVAADIPAATAEEAVEEEAAASRIASGEPVRTAPSENMRRRQEKEKEIYESEIARIIPREDSVSANLQRQMEESGETLAGVTALDAAPQKSASRFTEQLAAEMGTSIEVRAPSEPVRSISAERMEQQRARAGQSDAAEDAQSEIIDLTAVNQNNDTQPERETAQDKSPEQQSLLEELKDFVEGEPETAPPADIAAAPQPSVSTEFTEQTFETRPADAIAETQEAEATPPSTAPAPVTEHIASTPEMQVTRTVSHAQADFTDIPVDSVPAIPPAMAERRVSELEAKLAMLQRENEALNTELEMSLRSSEQERLEISSDNWNLEQATMRYNEAERQIARLGQQVQKERAQCAIEKKELEMMLFDPQMTEQAQLGHLAKLEDELNTARAEIKTLRAQLGN